MDYIISIIPQMLLGTVDTLRLVLCDHRPVYSFRNSLSNGACISI
jgi:hypothetical protein